MIIDLSSNNHPNDAPIDYTAAIADGVTAVIVKATQGTGYVNPFYAADVSGFASRGVPVIAYHFAEFGDPVAEAAAFIRVAAGGRARVLDVETNSDAAWHNAFLAQLGLPAGEIMDYGSADTLPRTGVNALLWVADYGLQPPFGQMWQFTSGASVAGIQGDVDVSQWTGTQAQYDAVFAISSPPKPTHTPQEIIMGLPSGCTDSGAVKCQIREWWSTYRSDPMTGTDQNLYALAFAEPLVNGGFGGDPDLMLAKIVDTAGAHLRPQFIGSV